MEKPFDVLHMICMHHTWKEDRIRSIEYMLYAHFFLAAKAILYLWFTFIPRFWTHFAHSSVCCECIWMLLLSFFGWVFVGILLLALVLFLSRAIHMIISTYEISHDRYSLLWHVCHFFIHFSCSLLLDFHCDKRRKKANRALNTIFLSSFLPQINNINRDQRNTAEIMRTCFRYRCIACGPYSRTLKCIYLKHTLNAANAYRAVICQ